MRIASFGPKAARAVEKYGSRFRITTLQTVNRELSISCMFLGSGGYVGRRRATSSQLLLIVRGQGWVRAGRGGRKLVGYGDAISRKRGEWHETGSDDGMTAIVVEYESPTSLRKTGGRGGKLD